MGPFKIRVVLCISLLPPFLSLSLFLSSLFLPPPPPSLPLSFSLSLYFSLILSSSLSPSLSLILSLTLSLPLHSPYSIHLLWHQFHFTCPKTAYSSEFKRYSLMCYPCTMGHWFVIISLHAMKEIKMHFQNVQYLLMNRILCLCSPIHGNYNLQNQCCFSIGRGYISDKSGTIKTLSAIILATHTQTTCTYIYTQIISNVFMVD